MKEHKLLNLLKKKRGFFEAILDLSETESELPVNEWLSVLEQKKVLLSCIEEIDEDLNPFKASLHALSQEVTEEIDKTKKVIQKILHLDDHHQEKRRQELRSYEDPRP